MAGEGEGIGPAAGEGAALPVLYGLTDPRGDRKLSAAAATRLLVDAGVRLVQVREKSSSDRDRLSAARECVAIARAAGARVVVNDRCDMALLAAADGVHLGEDDLPDDAARLVLGAESLVGISTHTVESAIAAMSGTATYVALGPIFPSSSKVTARTTLGLEAIAAVAERKAKPLVVIGGIGPDEVGPCLRAGADSVAMIAGLLDGDPVRNVARALESIARAGVANR